MFMPGFFRCLKENGERRIKIIGVDMAADPMMGQLLGETLPEVKVEYGAHLKRRYLDVIQMPQQEQP